MSGERAVWSASASHDVAESEKTMMSTSLGRLGPNTMKLMAMAASSSTGMLISSAPQTSPGSSGIYHVWPCMWPLSPEPGPRRAALGGVAADLDASAAALWGDAECNGERGDCGLCVEDAAPAHAVAAHVVRNADEVGRAERGDGATERVHAVHEAAATAVLVCCERAQVLKQTIELAQLAMWVGLRCDDRARYAEMRTRLLGGIDQAPSVTSARRPSQRSSEPAWRLAGLTISSRTVLVISCHRRSMRTARSTPTHWKKLTSV